MHNFEMSSFSHSSSFAKFLSNVKEVFKSIFLYKFLSFLLESSDFHKNKLLKFLTLLFLNSFLSLSEFELIIFIRIAGHI